MNFNFRHYYLDLFIDILFHLFIDVPFEFAKPWAEHLASLKQQSADRHVTPLGHIILILSQPVFALSP
jgi:hypothetical protein